MPSIDPLAEENVSSGLRDILRHSLSLNNEDITPEAQIGADLGADPFDILNIAWRVRTTFELALDKNDRGSLIVREDMSVRDLVEEILSAMLG